MKLETSGIKGSTQSTGCRRKQRSRPADSAELQASWQVDSVVEEGGRMVTQGSALASENPGNDLEKAGMVMEYIGTVLEIADVGVVLWW